MSELAEYETDLAYLYSELTDPELTECMTAYGIYREDAIRQGDTNRVSHCDLRLQLLASEHGTRGR